MSNLTQEQKEQIGAEIDNEGLEYWITNYGTFEGDDEELKILIEEARLAIEKLEDYLNDNDILF